ncbi:hypothetical protein F2Q69_00029320 [Brassica cretica]|uniref:Uncharacterized protein n=1 Tax=Brassica cretica TaxID=69181 RepID=A0A8S9S0X6_BRACR|nr:hypothetical protein F2Q69_00029320 [Brassica cretica]
MASKRRNNQRSCCFYIVDLWSLRMAMDRDTTKKSPRLKLIELGLFVADLDPEPALRPLDEVTTLVPRQFNWFLGPLEFLRRHLHNASFEKIFASRASCTKAGTHVLYSAQVNVKTSSEYYFARSCSMLRARQLILVKDGLLRHTRLWSLTNMPITRFRPSPRSTRWYLISSPYARHHHQQDVTAASNGLSLTKGSPPTSSVSRRQLEAPLPDTVSTSSTKTSASTTTTAGLCTNYDLLRLISSHRISSPTSSPRSPSQTSQTQLSSDLGTDPLRTRFSSARLGLVTYDYFNLRSSSESEYTRHHKLMVADCSSLGLLASLEHDVIPRRHVYGDLFLAVSQLTLYPWQLAPVVPNTVLTDRSCSHPGVGSLIEIRSMSMTARPRRSVCDTSFMAT